MHRASGLLGMPVAIRGGIVHGCIAFPARHDRSASMAIQGYEMPSTIEATYQAMAEVIGRNTNSGEDEQELMIMLTRHLAQLKENFTEADVR